MTQKAPLQLQSSLLGSFGQLSQKVIFDENSSIKFFDIQDGTAKGRKGALSQRRITMKHIIYYLQNHIHYKKSTLLHRAYLK